ncbi:uncharacterized protein LOC116071114 [Mastomys coucha]|uniref:uncharacterized protein LOC116071114 n=1 Tax=Mastomys coucha TaxID=35658 RepID=UPI0012614F7E|nr:uncharacterized protein LOC116071114 [Mastomys coucha]
MPKLLNLTLQSRESSYNFKQKCDIIRIRKIMGRPLHRTRENNEILHCGDAVGEKGKERRPECGFHVWLEKDALRSCVRSVLALLNLQHEVQLVQTRLRRRREWRWSGYLRERMTYSNLS